MKLLHKCGKFSVECNIVALIYLNRMSNTKHLPLTAINWRSVWLACITVAQKMWDDKPLKTSAFVLLVPPLTKANLRDFEIKVLQLLDFNVTVKPSLYVKYYFELRQLFMSIVGMKDSDWQVKPLSIRNAKRLEALSERSMRSLSAKFGTGTDTPLMSPRVSESIQTPSTTTKVTCDTLEDVTRVQNSSRFVLS
jgi:hypothetical protein